MTDSIYNGMFSISEVKRKLKNAAGEIVSHSFKHFETYDLVNDSVYSMEGKLVEEADQVSNNTSFYLRLIHTDTLKEVKFFLDYQYSKTPDKESFLDYTEFCIVPQLGEVKPPFVNRWINEQRNKLHDDIKKPTTLQTNLNEDQLKKLHKQLNEKYIKKISENDFIYLLTGQPINGIDKIKWLKAKTMAMNLFEKICLGFSFKTFNKCVYKNKVDFDDNNRSKVQFPEIEAILYCIK